MAIITPWLLFIWLLLPWLLLHRGYYYTVAIIHMAFTTVAIITPLLLLYFGYNYTLAIIHVATMLWLLFVWLLWRASAPTPVNYSQTGNSREAPDSRGKLCSSDSIYERRR